MYIEKIKVAETVAANWKNAKFEGLEVAEVPTVSHVCCSAEGN